MPTYEYACTECGERLEVVQSFSDDALTVCPVCQGKLRKLFSAVGVVFKGSGFYKTDSRSGKSKTAAATASSSGDSSKSTDSSSTSTSNGSETSTPSKSSEASKSTSSSSATSGGSDSTGGGSKVA